MFGFRRIATATLIAAGLVAGGVALAQAGTGAAAPLATASQNVATSFLANGNGNNGNGNNGNGAYGRRGHGGPGGYGGFGNGNGGFGEYQGRGGLVVAGVNGNTITATGRASQAITVTVSATTVYTEAGQPASLSDVTPGVNIAVQSTNAGTEGTGTNNTTITATAIYIILPSEAGVVTAVNGNTLTITGFNGATRTINVTGSTRYQSAGQPAALSNIMTGTAIVAEGTTDANGVLTAKVITIQIPRIGGQVTAVNGSSYTVSGRDSTTYTVNTTGSTTYVNPTYVNPNGSSATTTPTIAKGAFIMAEGTLSTDGKTMTAQRILVVPTGANGMGNGFGRHGGHGRYGFGAQGLGGQGFGGQGFGAATPGSTSSI